MTSVGVLQQGNGFGGTQLVFGPTSHPFERIIGLVGVSLSLLLPVAEYRMARRLWVPALPARGWARLYAEHVLPAHLGADLDFLTDVTP